MFCSANTSQRRRAAQRTTILHQHKCNRPELQVCSCVFCCVPAAFIISHVCTGRKSNSNRTYIINMAEHIGLNVSCMEHQAAGDRPTAAVGSAASDRCLPIPMTDEYDAANLSDSLAFLRRQLEYFQATPEDVQVRKAKGGKHVTIRAGQIGIRCIHCTHRPFADRQSGAVGFPTSTGLVYQAVRNWQRYHFSRCDNISDDLKTELQSLKRSHSYKAIGQYWIDSCHRKGLVDGQLLGHDGSAEVILLQNDGSDGNHAADKITSGDNSDDKHDMGEVMNPRMSEEKKCPSMSSLDMSNGLSEIDDLFGIDGGNYTGSAIVAGNGSDGTFNFNLTGEIGRKVDEGNTVHRTEKEGAAPSLVPAGEKEPVRESLADMEPIRFVRREQGIDLSDKSASDLLANSDAETQPDHLDPIGHHDAAALDAAALAASEKSTMNERVLQKVQEACLLVEAASELDAGDFAEDGKRRDLLVVGKHLYEHFSGHHSSGGGPSCATASTFYLGVETSADHRTKRGKTVATRTIVPLSDFGYPATLSDLVDQLYCSVDADGIYSVHREGMQYSSIKDVLDELQLMTRDPDRYLFGGDSHRSGFLHLVEGKLYGRGKELDELHKSFQRLRSSGGRSLLCITGDSGTGKSVLALQIRSPVESVGGFFLNEKFDELQQVKQVPVVFSALDAFCSEIVRRGGPILQTAQDRLQTAFGTEIQGLLSTIPSLGAIIGETGGDMPVLAGHAAFMRLLLCVRQLIKVIACQERPIVLMIDDLQWADEFSLALLEAIATDTDISSFLLIMCYRDGEVTEDHPLQKTLSSIQHSGAVLYKVHVENIDRSNVTTLTSDALQVLPSQARPLASLIYSKTSGQPLFVVQFLKSLYEEGLLRYSVSSLQWEWDAEKISEKSVADTVAEIMTGKMLRYSEEVLISLKLAACFGHEFDRKTLDLLGTQDDDGPSMSDNLDVALTDGLLIKSQTSTSTVYRFIHDQIQLAAYSLISVDEQTALHVEIARHLLSKIAPEKVDSVLFIITDQFGRGLSLIGDRGEKTRVAELYLRAAEKALSFFAHTAAATFSAQGISLLDNDHWRTDYRLALSLYSTSAEVHNIGGELEQVEASANIVFARAQAFDDKLPAYLSLVQAMGSQGLILKAMSIGLEVLKTLGLVLPANPDINTAMMIIDQTRAMLESIPRETVFAQIMQDEKALFAMKMLALLSRLSYVRREMELMAVIVCRMVQLTVEHGVCNISIISIGHFAYILANSGNLAVGHKYKHLALSLIDQSNAKEVIPLVYTQLYAQKIPIDPVQANFPQLEVAYRTALEHGNLEIYYMAMNREIATRFFFGDSLQSIETSARSHIKEMEKVKEKLYNVSTKLFLQATLNLINPACHDPSTLTGEIINQTLAEQMNYSSFTMQVSRLRIYIAYLFRQLDLASELVENVLAKFTGSEKKNSLFLPTGPVVPATFHIGLVSLHMARTKNADKWLPVAGLCMEKMKTWSEASPWNFGHMMRLMEAEDAYCKGDDEIAKAAYDDAICLAGEHKFIHDQALCLERAALYYADTCGDASDLSVRYMAEARELYAKWGAFGKVATI